jgi:hypothetical protein
MGQTIFVKEEHDSIDCGDPEPTPSAAPVEPSSTTSAYRPDPTSSTTWGPLEPAPVEFRGVEAAVEGEVTSSRIAPRHVQHNHPPQQMIGEINERVTRSRYYGMSHFADSTYVATFEPRDIRHALSDPNWVNAMHEELDNLRESRFGFWCYLFLTVIP